MWTFSESPYFSEYNIPVAFAALVTLSPEFAGVIYRAWIFIT